jgi:hypothetical protein
VPVTPYPLRGRIAVRPLVPRQTGLIIHPDTSSDYERSDQKSLGIKAQSSHRGIVLAKGAPMLTKRDAEVPHGFDVGDEVSYVFALRGTEESRAGEWNGEPCVWLGQEEIQAVFE